LSRWSILGVLFTARIGLAAAFQAVATALPVMVSELDLSYAQAGTLLGLFMLPGVFLAIPAGWLSVRLGDKPVAVLGLLALGLGCLIVAQATSFAAACFGRLVSGTGGILLTVMLAKMTTDWFVGRELATAMGCLLSSWPLGLAFAMAAFGWWMSIAGWQSVLALAAGFCLVALGLLALAYRPPAESALPPSRAGNRTPAWLTLSRASVELAALAGVIWGAFNAGIVLFLGFAPLALTDRGWPPSAAAAVASLLMWLCVPLLVLGGHLADRTGKGDRFIVATALVTGLAIAMLPYLATPLPAIILAGIVLGAPAGAIMALPQSLPPAERAGGFGIFYTVNYIAMSMLPPLTGGLVDLVGDPAPAMVLTGAVMASMAPFLWLLRARAAASARRDRAAI
jgi:MFS family permease